LLVGFSSTTTHLQLESLAAIEMVKPKLQKYKEHNSLFNKVSFTDTLMFRLKMRNKDVNY